MKLVGNTVLVDHQNQSDELTHKKWTAGAEFQTVNASKQIPHFKTVVTPSTQTVTIDRVDFVDFFTALANQGHIARITLHLPEGDAYGIGTVPKMPRGNGGMTQDDIRRQEALLRLKKSKEDVRQRFSGTEGLQRNTLTMDEIRNILDSRMGKQGESLSGYIIEDRKEV